MRNTYMEVLQMRKEAGATSKAVKEILSKIFPNMAQRLARAKAAKLFGKTRLGRRAVLPLAKDLPLAPFRATGMGLEWFTRPGSMSGMGNIVGRTNRGLLRALYGTAGAGLTGTGIYALLKPDSAAQKVQQIYDTGKQWLKDKAQGTDNGAPTQQIAGPSGSVLSLLNPISGITGGIDYVPKRYIDFWQNRLPDHKNTAGLIAHGTFKAGAIGLLAAALTGGYRAARHLSDIGSIDKANRPGKDMAGQLSTTFEGNLSGEDEEQKKAASIKTAQNTAQPDPYKIMSPGNFTAQNLTATAIPLGVLLLSAGLAYKGVDSAFDKLRNKRLDSAIAEKDQAVKKLITARAQLAKGEASMDAANAATADLKDSDVYTKAASQDKQAIAREAVQLFGTATAAVILASAIGSYAYTAASDENNLKYKAYKKALKEYAKAKSGITPITVAPKDAPSYFAAIDNAGKKQAPTARELPSYDADSLNRPISISI